MGTCCCKKLKNDVPERAPLVVSASHNPNHGTVSAVDFTTSAEPIASPPPAAAAPPNSMTRYPPPSPLPGRRMHTSEFQYLDVDIQCQGYQMKGPEFQSFPMLQKLFKKVYDKYEMVLMNRLKIDESLRSFKAVLQVDENLHMSRCFEKWQSLLRNPTFTIKCKKPDDSIVDIKDLLTGDSGNNSLEERGTYLSECLVSEITVMSADPKNLQKAQTHVNELLTACHLFLEQFQFFVNNVMEGLGEVSIAIRNIGQFTGHMGHSDRSDLRRRISRLYEDYEHMPGLMSKFFDHINIILREMTDFAPHCL